MQTFPFVWRGSDHFQEPLPKGLQDPHQTIFGGVISLPGVPHATADDVLKQGWPAHTWVA